MNPRLFQVDKMLINQSIVQYEKIHFRNLWYLLALSSLNLQQVPHLWAVESKRTKKIAIILLNFSLIHIQQLPHCYVIARPNAPKSLHTLVFHYIVRNRNDQMLPPWLTNSFITSCRRLSRAGIQIYTICLKIRKLCKSHRPTCYLRRPLSKTVNFCEKWKEYIYSKSKILTRFHQTGI